MEKRASLESASGLCHLDGEPCVARYGESKTYYHTLANRHIEGSERGERCALAARAGLEVSSHDRAWMFCVGGEGKTLPVITLE